SLGHGHKSRAKQKQKWPGDTDDDPGRFVRDKAVGSEGSDAIDCGGSQKTVFETDRPETEKRCRAETGRKPKELAVEFKMRGARFHQHPQDQLRNNSGSA